MSKEFLCPNCDCITSCSDAEIGFCCNNRCNTMTAIRLQHSLAEINTLTAKVKRYQEALEFYADRNNWKFYSYSNDCKDMIEFSDVGVKSYNEDADYACGSGGRRAREALKEME